MKVSLHWAISGRHIAFGEFYLGGEADEPRIGGVFGAARDVVNDDALAGADVEVLLGGNICCTNRPERSLRDFLGDAPVAPRLNRSGRYEDRHVNHMHASVFPFTPPALQAALQRGNVVNHLRCIRITKRGDVNS